MTAAFAGVRRVPEPINDVNRTYAPVQALVDELARCGMTHAVTCPGSRNAPLVLTLAADARIESVSVIDETSPALRAPGVHVVVAPLDRGVVLPGRGSPRCA